jgi:hypothetical protein
VKIWYFSCIHLDRANALSSRFHAGGLEDLSKREPIKPRVSTLVFDPGVEADVCVVAGDFFPDLIRSVEALETISKRMPVILVPGNRDYYRGGLFRPDTKTKLLSIAKRRAKMIGNIHVLDNDSVVIGDVTFIGSTLWTDLRQVSDPSLFEPWNDFRCIFVKPDQPFTPAHQSRAFIRSKAYIENELKKPRVGQRVVVSHTIPHPSGISERYKDNIYSVFFNNDFSDLLSSPDAPDAWVFGNNLDGCDVQVGSTRLLSNPHGHLLKDGRSENPNFRVDRTFELGVVAPPKDNVRIAS